MTKIIATLIVSAILGFSINAAHAQEGKKSLKSLMVEELSDYGRQLYNRGDYPQAANVYARILRADQGNVQAVKYLTAIKSKGYAVADELLVKTTSVKPEVVAVAAKPKEPIATPVAMPVLQENLDQDLADLQNDLKSLRETLRAKSEKIKILEKQLPSSL